MIEAGKLGSWEVERPKGWEAIRIVWEDETGKRINGETENAGLRIEGKGLSAED